MKKFLMALVISAVGLTLGMSSVEAKRLGGGGSLGNLHRLIVVRHLRKITKRLVQQLNHSLQLLHVLHGAALLVVHY